MTLRRQFFNAVPALILSAGFAAGVYAQGTANQPDERERQELLENQTGQSTSQNTGQNSGQSTTQSTTQSTGESTGESAGQDNANTESSSSPNGLADTSDCEALLAEENRTGSNSEGTVTSREGSTAGQANQGSGRSPVTGAGGTSASEGITGNPQGSHSQLNEGNLTLSLEECRNQQDALPNGRTNGNDQGAN